MRIKDFQIGSDRALVTFRNSRKRYLFFEKDSGKAYYRFRINTLDQTMHSGIYLGHDAQGMPYFVHNHTEEGYASIVPEHEFGHEQPLYEHPPENQPPPMEVITSALEKTKEGEPYDLLTNNCQTFTDSSKEGRRHSEDVLRSGLIAGATITSIAGAITYLLTRSGKR